MAQAVHPRFPIKGDEGQQTEEDDQRCLETVGDEGEELGQLGWNVIDGREAFHDSHVPGACAAGSGQEHADAGRGKYIEGVGYAEGAEFFKTGDEQPKLQEIAHPNGGAQSAEAPRPLKVGDGRDALPEVAQKEFDAAQAREGETGNQTDHASYYYIYGVAWGGSGHSACHAVEETNRVFPAQQNGSGNDENQAAHVGQFLHHNGAESLGCSFDISSPYQHTANEFAQTRRDTIDEIGNEDEFDGAPAANAQSRSAQQHPPAQRPKYVGHNTGKQRQRNPYIVGPLGKNMRQRAKVEIAIKPYHQPHPQEGEDDDTDDSLQRFGHGDFVLVGHGLRPAHFK